MRRSEAIHIGSEVLDNSLTTMDSYEKVDAILEALDLVGILHEWEIEDEEE